MRAKKRNKKILSLLIATLMIISMLPSSVFAATDDVMIEEYADVVTEEADVVDGVADEAAEVPDVAEQEVEADLAGASEIVSATAEGLLSGGKMTFDAVLDGVSVSAAVPASRAPQGSVMTVDLVDVADYADAIAAKIYGKDVSALKGLELHFYNKKGKEITHINTSDVTITADAMDADSYALCRLNGNSVGVVKKADASAFTFKEKKAYTYAIVGLVDDGVLRATAETGSNGVKSFNLDNIEVIAPEDAFGDDVAMEASDVTGDAATEEEALVGSSEDEVIAAYEISFYDEDGVEQQPKKEVTVKIATALDMSKNYKLIHIADNGETNEVENAVFTESGVEFTADSFSVYEVVAETKAEAKAGTKAISFNITRGDEQPSINATKTVTDTDGDGIYELALNVKATSQQSSDTNVTKSNVVMVIDVSGSMGNNNSWIYYDTYTYDADTYDSDGNGVRYYNSSTNRNTQLHYGDYYYNAGWMWPDWQYAGTGWYSGNENGGTAYTGTVYAWETRLHATQRAACAVVDALLEQNNNDDGITDIFEISVIKFANKTASGNYNETSTIIHDSTNAEAIKDAINDLTSGGGTNWEAALQLALTEANYYKNTDSSTNSENPEVTSVIFLTDGFPTFYGDDYYAGNSAGDENNTNIAKCYTEARDDARNIVSNGYTLYNIFAFGSDTTTYNNHTGFAYLRALTNYAYGTGSTDNYNRTTITDQYAFNAKSTDDLIAAFETIIQHLTNNVGYAGVNLSDGVSLGATSTSVAVNGTAKADSMRYTVKDASNKLSYTVKFDSSGKATFTIYNEDGTTTSLTDPSPQEVVTTINNTTITSQVYSVTVGEGESAKTYMMSPATIDADTGMVKWDLAGLGILESGYTYTVAFDVWANQLAYDIAADLNNGLFTSVDAALDAYNVTDATERQHIKDALVHNADGSYSLYTNYEQSVDYYPATSVTDDQGNTTWTYGDIQRQDLPHPDPIPLAGSSLPLEKAWEAGLSENELNELLWKDGIVNGISNEYKITLHIWKADTVEELETKVDNGVTETNKPYISKVLGWDDTEAKYIFTKAAAVAPGMMVNVDEAEKLGFDITDETKLKEFENDQGETVTYYVVESGHYYYATEEGADLHFELETVIYHPMVVDGTLYNVFFGEGKTVVQMDPMKSVTATNKLKGGLNITKVVSTTQIVVENDEINGVTEPKKDGIKTVTDEFTFEIKIWKEDEEGSSTAVYTTDDQIDTSETNPKAKSGSIGYRIFREPSAIDDNGEVTYDDLTRGAILEESSRYASLANGNFATIENGVTTLTLTMPANGEIRFVNIPSGTKYTVREIEDTARNYTYAATESIEKKGNETGEGNVTTNNEVSGTIKGNTASIENYYNWAASFYVYHSGDNTVEKISIADDRVKGEYDAGEGGYTYIFNIVNETKAQHLYGGYYKAYKGAGMKDNEIIKDDGYAEKSGTTEYTYADSREGGLWLEDEGAGAYPYDGDLVSWIKGDAYTVPGDTMEPLADTVYYLKEVPKAYLEPSAYVVYDEVDKDDDGYMQVLQLFMMTATDDSNYKSVGFDVTTSKGINNTGSYASEFWGEKVTVNKTGATDPYKEYTAGNIVNGHTGLIAGKDVTKDPTYIVKNAYFREIPYFVTLDNVKVTSFRRMIVYDRNTRWKSWTTPGMTKLTANIVAAYAALDN